MTVKEEELPTRVLVTVGLPGSGKTTFAKEAERRRAELAKTDPDHSRRIDKALNDGRVNFLLFGYGETHEPPATEKAIIGSQTIISYDTHTRKADIISLTHDIRAPEQLVFPHRALFDKPGE